MQTIKTSEYYKPRKVLIDDIEMTVTPLGAGDELVMNQAVRRIKLLDQKIANGTATDQDLDLYDNLETKMYAVFGRLFSDGTKDNGKVADWLTKTPVAVIQLVAEEIKKQVEPGDAEKVPTTQA